MEKKERSPAQRAADARYAAKGKHKTISFHFGIGEASEMEAIIAGSGMSKADFLRRAVQLYEEGKF